MKDLFRKIWNFIVNAPKDKLLHFNAGAGIDLYSYAVLCRFCPIWLAIVIANIIAVCGLLLKELYDARHPDGHSVEAGDVYWGLAGILVIDIAILIMVL